MKLDKCAIRQRIDATRKAQSALGIQAAGAAIRATVERLSVYRTAGVLVAYVSCGNEVPTERLVNGALSSGLPLYLPVVRGEAGFARLTTGAPLTPGTFGIPEPAAPITSLPELPTVVLLPLVACTLAGDRLGRGGGFYDRVFSNKPKAVTLIGLAFDFQVVPDLPRDPWDVRLDCVITERRVLWCDAQVTDRLTNPQEGERNQNGILLDLDRGGDSRSCSSDALRDVSPLSDASTPRQRRGDRTTHSR